MTEMIFIFAPWPKYLKICVNLTTDRNLKLLTINEFSLRPNFYFPILKIRIFFRRIEIQFFLSEHYYKYIKIKKIHITSVVKSANQF